jgi:hypothetical protein
MKTSRIILIAVILAFASCINNSPFCNRDEKFRGFMIDAARCVEKMDYYYRLIDFCDEWGFNSIIFRLTDDEGSAYKFTSHPELLTHEGAFTASELKKMVQYAAGKGIEIIPEIESFGHTKYITSVPRYKFLFDTPDSSWSNAICPVSDTTLKLMKDMYTEVSDIFPSCYFHIGCDEIVWGVTPMSKKAIETKTKSQIWAGYVNTLNGYVKSLGKKAIMWGDVPFYEDKDIADMLDKDIVIIDWNYWTIDPVKIDSMAHAILGRGFQLIGSPAVNWFMWGPRVGEYQFKNLNAYAKVYKGISDKNNLGIIVTHWAPFRYIQNCQWDTYAAAAEILKDDGSYQYMDAIKIFTEKYYGMTCDSVLAKAYQSLYENTPKHIFCGCRAAETEIKYIPFMPWQKAEQIVSIINNKEQLKNPFPQLKNTFMQYRDSVKKNADDYSEFMLTLDYLDYTYSREIGLWEFAKSDKTDLASVKNYITKVAEEDQLLVAKMDSVWHKGRTGSMDKGHVWGFYWAANYSKELAQNPQKLADILKKVRK